MKKRVFAIAALAAYGAAAITATKEYVDRQDADVRDGIAPVVSNTVTKAYVESLGIEAGISAETATNIAEEVSKLSERQGFTSWTIFREGVDVTARVAQPYYADGQGVWIVAHIIEDESMDFDIFGTADQTSLSWSARAAGGAGVSYYGMRYPMPGYVVGDQEDRPLASIVSVSNAHIAVADLRTNMAARIDAIASRKAMSTNEVCDIVTNETVVSEGGWRYSPTSVTLYGTVYVPVASGPMWDAISSKWVLVVENPEDGADVIPMAAPEGFSADVLHFSYEGMGSITASKDVVTRNTLGLARPSDVSNIVTKAYVESLGIEAGVSAVTATNIASDIASSVTNGLVTASITNGLASTADLLSRLRYDRMMRVSLSNDTGTAVFVGRIMSKSDDSVYLYGTVNAATGNALANWEDYLDVYLFGCQVDMAFGQVNNCTLYFSDAFSVLSGDVPGVTEMTFYGFSMEPIDF